MTETVLTLVIPWRNREELRRTLEANTAYLDAFGFAYEFLVVNCGGDPEQLQEILTAAAIPHIRTIFIGKDFFHKTYSLNVALSTIRSPYFMCLDTDVVLKSVDFPDLFRQIDEGHFVTMKEVVEEKTEWYEMAEFPDYINGIVAQRSTILFELKDGREIPLKLDRRSMINNHRTGPGILIASLADMQQAGGYNGELSGWGWEDLDMVFRLQVLGRQRLEAGTVLHLSHENDSRAIAQGFSNKIENEADNFNKCIINYQLGIFDGSLKEDAR